MELGMDIQKSFGKFRKNISARNFVEIGTCVLLVPVFAYRCIMADSLWSAVMNLEIAFAAVFIGIMLLMNGQISPSESDSLSLKNLKAEYEEALKTQISLLSKFRWWYIAPISLGVVGLKVEDILVKISNQEYLLNDLGFLSVFVLGVFSLIYLNEVKTVGKFQDELKRVQIFEFGD